MYQTKCNGVMVVEGRKYEGGAAYFAFPNPSLPLSGPVGNLTLTQPGTLMGRRLVHEFISQPLQIFQNECYDYVKNEKCTKLDEKSRVLAERVRLDPHDDGIHDEHFRLLQKKQWCNCDVLPAEGPSDSEYTVVIYALSVGYTVVMIYLCYRCYKKSMKEIEDADEIDGILSRSKKRRKSRKKKEKRDRKKGGRKKGKKSSRKSKKSGDSDADESSTSSKKARRDIDATRDEDLDFRISGSNSKEKLNKKDKTKKSKSSKDMKKKRSHKSKKSKKDKNSRKEKRKASETTMDMDISRNNQTMSKLINDSESESDSGN
jgi:hypothetical protein